MRDYELTIVNNIIEDISNLENDEDARETSQQRFYIPRNVTAIDPEATLLGFYPDIIEVEEGNTAFLSKGNCLLSKDGEILHLISKKSDFSVLDGIKVIDNSACCEIGDNEKNKVNITIPESVEEIGYRAFATSAKSFTICLGMNVKYIATQAFFIKAKEGPVKVKIQGDPELEPGVFGTKEELKNYAINNPGSSLSKIIESLPEFMYIKPEDICVTAPEDGKVYEYCKKFNIPVYPL